jgi:branched-chain amino acid transport system permease protein
MMKALLFALYLVMLFLAPHFFYPIALMKIMCFALFACAFNLLFGFTGLLSFGHAAFFGIGSYAAAYSLKHFGVTTEVGMLIGCIVAAVLGAAIGLLAIRRFGIYFSMITLALAQLVFFACLQSPWTGGEDGLQAVPRGELLGIWSLRDDLAVYVFVSVICTGGVALIWKIVYSPYGEALKAIRESESRAMSLGYNVDRYKLGAFIISAALSGCAGALKAIVLGFATLTDVAWTTSGDVVLMTLLGGLGTIFGPAVGATLVVVLNTELADRVGNKVTVIVGLAFIVCVLSFRKGIVGELLAWRKAARSDAEITQSPELVAIEEKRM